MIRSYPGLTPWANYVPLLRSWSFAVPHCSYFRVNAVCRTCPDPQAQLRSVRKYGSDSMMLLPRNRIVRSLSRQRSACEFGMTITMCVLNGTCLMFFGRQLRDFSGRRLLGDWPVCARRNNSLPFLHGDRLAGVHVRELVSLTAGPLNFHGIGLRPRP